MRRRPKVELSPLVLWLQLLEVAHQRITVELERIA